MGEIKPTGEGLANRECGRPDYADLPPLALSFMAQGFPYWEEDPEQDKVELCYILDRLFEAIEFSGDFLGFARLIGQAMAGMSVYMLGHRSARWHGYETYDSVPRQAVERWAATYTEGAAKYGAYNWRKGLKIRNLLSHAIGHVYLLADDNRSENHFGHFLWNCGTAIWMARNRPELDDRFGSPLAPKGATLSNKQAEQNLTATMKPLVGKPEKPCSISGCDAPAIQTIDPTSSSLAGSTPIDTFLILSQGLNEAREWAKANGFCVVEKTPIAGRQWVWCNCQEVIDHYVGAKVVILPSGDAPTKAMRSIKAYLTAKINSGELHTPADFPSHQCRVGPVAVWAESDKAALRWADAHNVPHDLIIRVDKLSQLRDLPPGTYVVDLLETCIGLLPARLWLVRSELLQHVASGKFVMWEDTVSVVGV